MKIYTAILLLTLSGCTTFKPIPDLPGKVIRGKIIDKESGEVFIGKQIREYGTYINAAMTNISGEFELVFKETIPIIILEGHYDPVHVSIKPDEYNIIEYGHKTIRKSSRLSKRARSLSQKMEKA
ncbi:MAG: hypothetical protein AAGA77_10785 [Bacteroidota bacterium]